ncbi:MAG: hypothetical protein LUD22_01950 [Coprobacillus sp.]|nr:hypothetical protein [Coprobacillus sp.]
MHKKSKVTRSGYTKKPYLKNDKAKRYYYKGNQNSKTKTDFAANVGKGRVVSRKILSPGVSVKQGDIDFLNHTHRNYTKKDLVFVTKDKKNNPLWLEKGDESDGLKHIRGRRKKNEQNNMTGKNKNNKSHLEDFWKKFRLGYTRIPRELKKIIVKGDTIPKNLKKYTGKDVGFRYKGGYVYVAFGNNGYIVTAFPTDEPRRKKKK